MLPWLNGLPEVLAVLAREFVDCPITKQNLCEWRAGGFKEWQAHQETLGDLAAEAGELEAVTEGRLTDHLTTGLAARYAAALAGWDGEVSEELRRKLRTLHGLCQDIVELRRGDHSGARLQMEREREKTEEEVVAHFERWARNPSVRDWIYRDWLNPEERRRRMREIFGLAPEPSGEESPTLPEANPVQLNPTLSNPITLDEATQASICRRDADSTLPTIPAASPVDNSAGGSRWVRWSARSDDS